MVFCCEAPTPYSIVKPILNYQKKDSIDSKVDMNPPFDMLLVTPYGSPNHFFSNFY
jgi:hypothetical protein